MKIIKFIYKVCFLLILISAVSYGQNNKNASDTIKYNTWSASISGGSMLFFGDIKQFDFYPVSKKNSEDWYNLKNGISERKWGFGIDLSKQLSTVFGIWGILENGNLAGMKDTTKTYFNASILTCGLNLTVNILPIINPEMKSPKIAVYGIFGIGLCKFKTIEKDITTDTLIFSYGYGEFKQKKKRTTEIDIPLGAGVKYKFTNNVDIGLESILNNINTYKLDGGNVYNSSRKDKYLYTALTVTYTFGKNKSLEWTTHKGKGNDKLAPVYNALAHKIDSLSKKLAEVENKNSQFQKDIDALKNPPKEADDDGDGVPNSKDMEPNTPKGSLVDANGMGHNPCRTWSE